MDVVDALNTRFTVRAFKPDPIDYDTLEKVMEAALRCTTYGVGPSQPSEIIW